MFSMFAGSQFVHIVYRPLEDMETLVSIEMKQLKSAIDQTTEDIATLVNAETEPLKTEIDKIKEAMWAHQWI